MLFLKEAVSNMAERRMFAKTIIDSDAFLDMPLSSQALYFHLSMRADDDGFINNAKKIQRMLGCADDDLKILLAKNFIIPFETGVCVIKHWRIHNLIQKDRYKPSVYHEEKEKLSIKNNNVYTMDTKCLQDVSKMESQVSIGKASLVEESKTNRAIALAQTDEDFEVFWNMYPKKKDKIKAKAAWKKEKPPIDLVLKALEWQINSKDWVKENGKFIKYPERYITHGSWMDVESVSQSVDFTQWLGVGKPELKIVKDVEND